MNFYIENNELHIKKISNNIGNHEAYTFHEKATANEIEVISKDPEYIILNLDDIPNGYSLSQEEIYNLIINISNNKITKSSLFLNLGLDRESLDCFNGEVHMRLHKNYEKVYMDLEDFVNFTKSSFLTRHDFFKTLKDNSITLDIRSKDSERKGIMEICDSEIELYNSKFCIMIPDIKKSRRIESSHFYN